MAQSPPLLSLVANLIPLPHQSLKPRSATPIPTRLSSPHTISHVLGVFFFLASSHKSTQALPTSPAAHPWCPSLLWNSTSASMSCDSENRLSHSQHGRSSSCSSGVLPECGHFSFVVETRASESSPPTSLSLVILVVFQTHLTVPLRPMLKRDTPPSRTLAPQSVQMSTSLHQLPTSKSNSSAKGIGHILPRPDHHPVYFFFCVRARLPEGPCFSARVIVQCVVSLLFLVIQCTHSAFVNARTVAGAWNLASQNAPYVLGSGAIRHQRNIN